MAGEEGVAAYSAPWLRERGAKFDPLTGEAVPPPVEEISSVASPSGLTPPEGTGATSKPTEPTSNAVEISSATSTSGSTPPEGTGATSKPTEPILNAEDALPRRSRKAASRVPLIIGMLVAIGAVVAARLFLVPFFSHSEKAPAPIVRSPSPPAEHSTAPVLSPVTHVPIAPQQKSIPAPESVTEKPVESPALPPPSSISSPKPAQVTPVQTSPQVVQASPEVRPVAPSPAAQPRHSETKAQYEQMHLHQLLSPLS